jgi:hypothetical protein
MAEFVEHVEHPILASIVGAVLDEVVGPDMIALLRPQPNARSVGQPEPAALGLLMGNLQPLALPDTLDPLVVDYPARLAQQRGDLAIAIAAVVPGKLDNIGGETLLVVTAARDLALRRAMLPECHQAPQHATNILARTRYARQFEPAHDPRAAPRAELAGCVIWF